jgi:hypothetical protein
VTWTWAEPFAGAAACALRLVGGERLKPPVAWMGGKRRYARAIVDAMGVPEGPPSRVLLADAGPWGWVWPLLLSGRWVPEVASCLRSWAHEHPRELWQRLAACPPSEDVFARAAQWLWLQARSASGVPIWWDGWRTNDARWVSTRPQQAGGVRDAKHALDTRKDRLAEEGAPRRRPKRETRAVTDRGEDLRWPAHQAQRAAWLASDGRGQPRPAGARAVGGRWEKGNEGRVQDATNGQRGAWRFAGRPDRAQEDRPAAMSGDHSLAGWRMGEEVKKARRGDRTVSQGKGSSAGRTGGMVNPVTIADRIEALARAFADVDVAVHHGSAHELEPAPGFAYLDPPYVGATGYGWDMPRAEVLALARRWADAGAVVAVSEAEPLALEGWHHLDLTREGGKSEWLTLSRASARAPARQASLFPSPSPTA